MNFLNVFYLIYSYDACILSHFQCWLFAWIEIKIFDRLLINLKKGLEVDLAMTNPTKAPPSRPLSAIPPLMDPPHICHIIYDRLHFLEILQQTMMKTMYEFR